jgi:hypothetical protein
LKPCFYSHKSEKGVILGENPRNIKQLQLGQKIGLTKLLGQFLF